MAHTAGTSINNDFTSKLAILLLLKLMYWSLPINLVEFFNSGSLTDLIDKLQDINFKNKIIATFNQKSLFTNVLVEGVLKAVIRAIDDVNDDGLPVCKSDYMKFVTK